MGYWKSRVVPMFRWITDRNAGKKATAAEVCKSFEASKDSYNKEFEEKKAKLQPKVLEIYDASSADVKTFVKERTEAGLKKNSNAVHSFLEQLVKLEFPGSQVALDGSSKFGAAYVVEPIFFVFEKVSRLVITEEREDSTEEREVAVEEVTEKTQEKAAEPATVIALTQEEEKAAEPASDEPAGKKSE